MLLRSTPPRSQLPASSGRHTPSPERLRHIRKELDVNETLQRNVAVPIHLHALQVVQSVIEREVLKGWACRANIGCARCQQGETDRTVSKLTIRSQCMERSSSQGH